MKAGEKIDPRFHETVCFFVEKQAERIDELEDVLRHVIVMCQTGGPEYSSIDIEDIARTVLEKNNE